MVMNLLPRVQHTTGTVHYQPFGKARPGAWRHSFGR